MIPILIWIVGCCAILALVVHIVNRSANARPEGQADNGKHFILLADNQEQRMEWYLRSITWFARRTGTNVRITVIDQGMSRDTLRIVSAFSRGGTPIYVANLGADAEGEQPPRVFAVRTEGRRPAEGLGTEGSAAAMGDAESSVNDAVQYSDNGRKQPRQPEEPHHLMWRLREDGIVQQAEHAVVVDLREPGGLQKLPFY